MIAQHSNRWASRATHSSTMAWSLLLLAIAVALTALLPVVPGNATRFLIGLALIAARLVSMEWFKKPQHGFMRPLLSPTTSPTLLWPRLLHQPTRQPTVAPTFSSNRATNTCANC